MDPRIVKYRDIVAAMKQGIFDFEIPDGPEDEIGQLARIGTHPEKTIRAV